MEMKSGQINEMLKTKRLKLSLIQLVMHYYIVIIPLIPFFFTLILKIKNSVEIGYFVWLWLLLAFIFYFRQHRKLQFLQIKGNWTQEDIQDALARVSVELNWFIEVDMDNYIVASRESSFSTKSGDLITLIIEGNNLMINSISDPRGIVFPFKNFSRKENITKFIKHLNDVLRKQPEDISHRNSEREWSSKRVVTRLVMYPFCVMLGFFSLEMIAEPLSSRSLSAGIFGVVFSVGYIVVDIILILKHMDVKK